MKKISVIIPVYNAERWLSETLDSLVTQTYSNMEIVCVDDGSKDDSCEIIRRYQKVYTNICLVQQSNSGVCAARNNGIVHATGDYIAFVDSDDYVELNMYEQMISLLEKENSDIVFCEFTRFWADGHRQTTIEHSFEKLLINPHDVRYYFYSTPGYLKDGVLHTDDIHGSVCRSVFKKDLINNNRIVFHTDLKFAEDQIFVLEYLKYCKKISYTPNAYVWYRGWTKERRYGHIYENQMALVRHQEKIILDNDYYTLDLKKQLIGYIKCSAYFVILNDEFSLNPNCVERMKEYAKDKRFTSLLTLYNFSQKYRIRPDKKRIVLFVFVKLRLWKIIRRVYPTKYY